MPANLTPQYHKAEDEYRRATSPEEELAALQVMLREMPKHKGTDRLQSDLKQKISRLKKEVESAKSSAKKGGGFRLVRQGAGTCVLLGGPNAGKSRLLAALTNAEPEVAPYPFTTRQPQPAMMPWEDVQVQLVDTPPITADYLEAYMQGLIRGADLILLAVDLGDDDGIDQCQELLTRLDGTKTRLGEQSLLDDADIGRSYTKTFLVANKVDAADAAERLELMHELLPLPFEEFVVSAETGDGLEVLKRAVYESLDVVRIYTKHPKQREADYENPFTVRRGGTLLDVAELVHRDFAENLKFARVWGEAVHDGAQVKGDYILHDKDVVELHAG